MLFIASLYDDNVLDVSADGNEIVITDNSNYSDTIGTATAGGATSITLAVGSSDIDDYYNDLSIEITDGTGVGQKANITDYNATTRVATVDVTWSVTPDNTSEYEIGEAGHLKSDFSTYYKLSVTDYDGTVFTYAISGGDEDVTAPSDVLSTPISIVHDYTSGDGEYAFKLISVPKWGAYAKYLANNYPCVEHNGVLYRAVANSQNVAPDSVGGDSYWEAITDSELYSKYISEGTAVFICLLKQCYVELVKKAIDVKTTTNTDILQVDDMKKALELMLIIENIQGLVNSSDWNSVNVLINKGKVICDCCV